MLPSASTPLGQVVRDHFPQLLSRVVDIRSGDTPSSFSLSERLFCDAKPFRLPTFKIVADQDYLNGCLAKSPLLLVEILSVIDISQPVRPQCVNELKVTIENQDQGIEDTLNDEFLESCEQGRLKSGTASRKRFAKVLMSDGIRFIVGIEYRPVPFLEPLLRYQQQLYRGKERQISRSILGRALLYNSPQCIDGVVLLEIKNIRLLSSVINNISGGIPLHVSSIDSSINSHKYPNELTDKLHNQYQETRLIPSPNSNSHQSMQSYNKIMMTQLPHLQSSSSSLQFSSSFQNQFNEMGLHIPDHAAISNTEQYPQNNPEPNLSSSSSNIQARDTWTQGVPSSKRHGDYDTPSHNDDHQTTTDINFDDLLDQLDFTPIQENNIAQTKSALSQHPSHFHFTSPSSTRTRFADTVNPTAEHLDYMDFSSERKPNLGIHTNQEKQLRKSSFYISNFVQFFGMCLNAKYIGSVGSVSNVSDGYINTRPSHFPNALWDKRQIPLPTDHLWVVNTVSTHHHRSFRLLVRVREGSRTLGKNQRRRLVIDLEDNENTSRTTVTKTLISTSGTPSHYSNCNLNRNLHLPTIPQSLAQYDPDVLVFSPASFNMMHLQTAGLFISNLFGDSAVNTRSILLGTDISRCFSIDEKIEKHDNNNSVLYNDSSLSHHSTLFPPQFAIPSFNNYTNNGCRIQETQTTSVISLDGEIISWSPKMFTW